MVSLTINFTSIDEVLSYLNSMPKSGSTGQFPVNMVGAAGIEPAQPIKSNGRFPAAPSDVKINLNAKPGPGRPPMSAQAKALKAKKLLEEIQQAKSEIITPKASVITAIEEAPVVEIKREDLQLALQGIINTKGIDKVLKILALVGAKHLRDVTPDKYPQVMAMAQAEASL